jgi:hypothetical protein
MIDTRPTRQVVSSDPSGIEGGAHARHGFDHVAYCAPVSAATSFHTDAGLLGLCWRRAAVEAVSADGIALSLKTKVAPGGYLVVELRRASQSLSRTLLVRVAQATARVDGSWHIACSFEDESGLAKLSEER